MFKILNPDPDQFLGYEDNFLTDTEIDTLLAKAEAESNYGPADVRQPDGTYKMIPSYRTNDRGVLVLPTVADGWYDRFKGYLPDIRFHSPCSLDKVIKFYRYKKGDFFNWHKDAAINGPNGEKSKVTFMVYLSNVGVTQYDFSAIGRKEDLVTVESLRGRMVLFNHKITHCSPALEDGIKVSCRADVLYKMNLPT
jgi:hypothetical protein